MRMQTKIAVVLALMIGGLVLLMTVLMYGNWFSAMQKQVALDAKDAAIIIAENESIQRALTLENGYISTNKAVERIHLKTGIQYLYVLNQEGLYFAHPIPEKVNTPYEQGDTRLPPLVLEPVTYYTLNSDAMVEAYVPVYTDGVVSGSVVVGIYNGRILQTIRGHAISVIVIAVLAIAAGIGMAYVLSKNIKKAMFDLEPEAIALLFNQQETILEHIGEGVLATDLWGNILVVNENAKKLLNRPDLKIGDAIDTLPFLKDKQIKEMRIDGQKTLKVDRKGLSEVDQRLGTLYKFEDMSLVRERAEELTDMKQLTQALRAQNHEFMNKLHTISGLLQLEAFSEAQGYIEEITKARSEMVEAINHRIKVPVLSGLILAKHSRAAEKRIVLTIDEEALVEKLPSGVLESDMTSILGNLIDNAMDALSPKGGTIHLDLYEDALNFVMSVCDDGPGIDDALMPFVFERGFSTKGDGRGFGLAIVQEKIKALGGSIHLANQEGLCVTAVLPMKAKEVL